MSNIWENYKLVSLILCVNFSTKFRLIEISFSGGHFIIVRVVKRRETTGKHHTPCVVPQVAHCAIAKRVAPSRATTLQTTNKFLSHKLWFGKNSLENTQECPTILSVIWEVSGTFLSVFVHQLNIIVDSWLDYEI
jgi:hypothetical protein